MNKFWLLICLVLTASCSYVNENSKQDKFGHLILERIDNIEKSYAVLDSQTNDFKPSILKLGELDQEFRKIFYEVRASNLPPLEKGELMSIIENAMINHDKKNIDYIMRFKPKGRWF